MIDLNKWEFLPAQKAFFEALNVHKYKYAAYIGGLGAGKTFTGALQAIITMLKYPGSFGLIGRLESTALRNTSRRTFVNLLEKLGIQYQELKHENLIKIPVQTFDEAGKPVIKVSEVLLWHLDDIGPIGSLNIDWFWVDEAFEIPENVFLMLQSRIRGELGQPLQGWITTTPNGMDWIYKRFVANTNPESKKYYFYVVSKTSENKFLPKDLLENLYTDYPEEWRRKYLDAEFTTFEGQIYPEFNDSIHVIEPFFVPSGWGWVRVIDPGYRNPTAVIWAAINPDGQIFIVDEYLQSELPLHVHARNIIDKTFALIGEKHCLTLIDPAAKQKTANSEFSVIEQLRRAPFFINAEPANNNVLAGIQRVKQYLNERKLFIFRNCTNTIEQLKNYRWKPINVNNQANPKEEPLKKDDHLCDCVRYLIMHRFSTVKFSEFDTTLQPYHFYKPTNPITGY